MNKVNNAFFLGLKSFLYTSCFFILLVRAYTVVNYHTSVCSGSEVSCRGNSLNSAGDLVVWDTKGAPLIEYGEISNKTKSITANISKNSNKLILSFTPTKVSSTIKGNMIRVLFVFIPIKDVDGMNLPDVVVKDVKDLQSKDQGAKTVISVYRQIISPKDVSQQNSEWVNVATLGTMAKVDEIKKIKADLSPDGIATVFTRDIEGNDLPTIINLAMEY